MHAYPKDNEIVFVVVVLVVVVVAVVVLISMVVVVVIVIVVVVVAMNVVGIGIIKSVHTTSEYMMNRSPHQRTSHNACAAVPKSAMSQEVKCRKANC